ncbi:hypothetical protein N9Z72_00140 [Akkermansiaceae bacterium]|nr:hypothetical protein [Akkermansiaceae bacterium]
MAISPNNYAPVTRRSLVAHQPGQKDGEKIKSGRDYSIEFDDALLSQQGWMNPRLDGCEIISLFPNKFSPRGTSRQLGGIKSPNIQHLVNISQSWEGDSGNLDRNPGVETYTNSIFFGNTLSGYEEDPRFPNVGEDFSYIFVNKAYTFDPDNDEYFITELLGSNDKVFERVLKQDLSYASKFSIRLLDEGTEHDLDPEYNVHWNAGMFSLVATYKECAEFPFTQELQVTTQYAADKTDQNYYGINYNPSSSNNPSQNNVPFLFNSNNRTILTGSFTVENNKDTWWWRRPRTSSYFAVGTTLSPHNSASGLISFPNGGSHLHTTGDYSTSVFGFFNSLMSKTFTFQNINENQIYGTAPAKKDLHILTFNDAKGCVKDIQTELRYTRNTTQALRHFGSISLSPGRKIPVPGCAKAIPSLASNHFSINSKIVGPSFDEFVVQTGEDSGDVYDYYTWFVGGNATGSEAATGAYTPPSPTGSGNFEGAPRLKTFTISKLVKRPNVIMADVNKINELFDGIGGQGFLCIPENLNPKIKNNLDYFLKKAELIEKGPNRKNLAAKTPRILREPPEIKGSHLNPKG